MEKTMDSGSAKIRAISSIIVAIIVAIGLIVSAVILAGGDYGREANRYVTVGGGEAAKAMESNMEMNVMMMDGSTKIGMQRARYDYDANTILVETANISGFRPANIAIDYDRSVVFIEIRGQSLCLASALSGHMVNMADRFTNFMMDSKQQAIDIATARVEEINYAQKGEIPAGYVTNSNGPIIRGLCAGAVSQWTEQRVGGARRKRAISGEVQVCIFGFCFTISF